jgi:3-oxoacyl-[acyl-carrier protein] reductase
MGHLALRRQALYEPKRRFAMRDYLLELAQDRRAHKLVRALGFSVPLPVRLRRSAAAWRGAVLSGRSVAIGGVEHGELAQQLGKTLAEAGADAWIVGSDRAAQAYRGASSAWTTPISVLPPVAPSQGAPADALLYDATGIKTSDGLRAIYDFFHTWLGHLAPAGRIVIVARPVDGGDWAQAAARGALTGFCKSLAKEVGRTGVSANLIQVHSGAEDRVGGAVRFLLSDYSAFITAQTLQVTARARPSAEPRYERCLQGKVALVTGAAGGIGRTVAQTLAREGAQVMCLDLPQNHAALERVVQSLASLGAAGGSITLDVADASAPGGVVQQLRQRHGGVDIVVHNAGIARDKSLLRMKSDAWDGVIRTNLSAAVRITDSLLSEGLLRDEGRIVVLAAVAAIAGNAGQTNYAASKAGLAGLIQGLAPMVADRGITANAVAPGLIETDFLSTMPAALRQFARRMSALAQGGQPEDVAEAVMFLASPSAQGITGETLRVCGGAFAGT